MQPRRGKVETDHVENDAAGVLDGIRQEPVDQRITAAGKLCPGMLGYCLGIERDPHDRGLSSSVAGRQHQVVNLRLDLVPHAAGDLRVIAQELLQWRKRFPGSHVLAWVHAEQFLDLDRVY